MSNDLDLDELHKQVSKLMDQAGKSKVKKAPSKSAAKSEPTNDTPKEPAVTPPEEPAKEPPKQDEPKADDEKIELKVGTKTDDKKEDAGAPITVRRPMVQVMPRRPGVAMDIVQPVKTGVEPPSARASRTAPTIQPTGPVESEPPHPRETIVASAPTPAKEKEDVSEETLASLNLQKDSPRPASAPEESAKSTFPDPLDVHGFKDGEEDKPSGDSATTNPPTMEHTAPAVTPSSDKPADESSEPPADNNATPFVNAKVEKRPLGAFAGASQPEQTTVEPEEPGETPKDASKEEKSEAAAINVPAPPKELNPELVAVESSEPEFTPGSPEAKKTSMSDLRQMSIPPQYKSADAEPSKEDRPIFDTKTYHPPLQPVAKVHKGGGGSRAGMLLTLILIILLVAAGVVAYFVATGSIDVNSILKSF
jgi:hypothetical protein